jgi:protein TonB
VPGWQAQIAQRLAQFRRYPPRARLRGVQGVALLRFSIDRAGHVLSASLARSAGSAELDEETLALIHRADPLPPPPPSVPGNPVVLTVPIQFSLR